MLKNEKININQFLRDMYGDQYYPKFLVDKCRDILAQMCEKIEEKQPKNLEELYEITQKSTEEINDLQDEFYKNNSDIETIARESLAEEFFKISEAYGFEADLETLIATRDW